MALFIIWGRTDFTENVRATPKEKCKKRKPKPHKKYLFIKIFLIIPLFFIPVYTLPSVFVKKVEKYMGIRFTLPLEIMVEIW